MSCNQCEVSEAGFSVGLEWGLTINETFLAALAINAVSAEYHREGTVCLFPLGCGKSESQGRDIVVTMAPTVRFYPFPERGAFVRGGVGLGFTGISDPDVAFDFGIHTGIGATLGFGWDFALGSTSMALTPSVISGWIKATEQSATFVQAGVGITFH